MDEAQKPGTLHPVVGSTELAFQRTALAYERTLMAWIRTAVSMISFGFTIYKFLGDAGSRLGEEKLLSPRAVGMIMISFALLSLMLAQLQHNVAIKKLKSGYPDLQRSISSLLGILVLIFGFVTFIAALFKQ